MNPQRHEPSGHENENPEVAHEGSDVNVSGIIGFGAGLVICTALICLVLIGMFRFLRQGFTPKPVHPSPMLGVREPLPAEKAPQAFPEPRLQVDYYRDLSKVTNNWNNELNTYGWVDKKTGVAHIPIERAMQVIVQRGLPTRVPGQLPPSVEVLPPIPGSPGVAATSQQRKASQARSPK